MVVVTFALVGASMQAAGQVSGSGPWVDITDILEAPDGRLLILDSQSQTVFARSHQGAVVRWVGAGGEGPGEFLNIRRGGWSDGAFWVADRRLGRLTRFSYPDGEVLGSTSFNYYDGRTSLAPDYLLADGTILAIAGVPSRLVAEGRVRARSIIRLDSDGAVLDTIASTRLGSKVVAVSAPNDGSVMVANPLTPVGLVAVSPAGERIYLLEPQDDVEASGRMRLTALRHDGSRVYERELGHMGPELTWPRRIALAGALYSVLQDAGAPDLPAQDRFVDEYIESASMPERIVGFDQIEVGSDGSVWVRRTVAPGVTKEAVWEVYTGAAASPTLHTVSSSAVVLAVSSQGAWLRELAEWDLPTLSWSPLGRRTEEGRRR